MMAKLQEEKGPSYPVGSGDWKKVQMVIDELVEGEEEGLLSTPVMLTKDCILTQLEEIIGLTEDRPSSEKTRYLDVHTAFISYKMTGIFEYAFYHLTDDLKLLCDVNEAEGLETCDKMLKVVEKLDSDDDEFIHSLIASIEAVKDIVEERRNVKED